MHWFYGLEVSKLRFYHGLMLDGLAVLALALFFFLESPKSSYPSRDAGEFDPFRCDWVVGVLAIHGCFSSGIAALQLSDDRKEGVLSSLERSGISRSVQYRLYSQLYVFRSVIMSLIGAGLVSPSLSRFVSIGFGYMVIYFSMFSFSLIFTILAKSYWLGVSLLFFSSLIPSLIPLISESLAVGARAALPPIFPQLFLVDATYGELAIIESLELFFALLLLALSLDFFLYPLSIKKASSSGDGAIRFSSLPSQGVKEGLWRDLTVNDHIACYTRICGFPINGVEDLPGEKVIGQLTPYERRMLSVAIACAPGGRIQIDSLTAGLDLVSARKVRQFLKKFDDAKPSSSSNSLSAPPLTIVLIGATRADKDFLVNADQGEEFLWGIDTSDKFAYLTSETENDHSYPNSIEIPRREPSLLRSIYGIAIKRAKLFTRNIFAALGIFVTLWLGWGVFNYLPSHADRPYGSRIIVGISSIFATTTLYADFMISPVGELNWRNSVTNSRGWGVFGVLVYWLGHSLIDAPLTLILNGLFLQGAREGLLTACFIGLDGSFSVYFYTTVFGRAAWLPNVLLRLVTGFTVLLYFNLSETTGNGFYIKALGFMFAPSSLHNIFTDRYVPLYLAGKIILQFAIMYLFERKGSAGKAAFSVDNSSTAHVFGGKGLKKCLIDFVACQKSVAFVSSDINYLPHLTVRENLVLVCRLRGLPTSLALDQISSWNLLQVKDVCARSLSPGILKKLEFSIALLGGVKVLVVEEDDHVHDIANLASVVVLGKSRGLLPSSDDVRVVMVDNDGIVLFDGSNFDLKELLDKNMEISVNLTEPDSEALYKAEGVIKAAGAVIGKNSENVSIKKLGEFYKSKGLKRLGLMRTEFLFPTAPLSLVAEWHVREDRIEALQEWIAGILEGVVVRGDDRGLVLTVRGHEQNAVEKIMMNKKNELFIETFDIGPVRSSSAVLAALKDLKR